MFTTNLPPAFLRRLIQGHTAHFAHGYSVADFEGVGGANWKRAHGVQLFAPFFGAFVAGMPPIPAMWAAAGAQVAGMPPIPAILAVAGLFVAGMPPIPAMWAAAGLVMFG